MATTLDCFATGKTIASATIASYTVGTDCVVSSAVRTDQLYGSLENFEWSYEETTENLSPMNSPLANPVPNEVAYQVTADIYLSSKGTSVSGTNGIRKYILQSSGVAGEAFNNIVLVQWREGEGSTYDTIGFWGRITSYKENFTKGKGMGTIKIDVIAVYTTGVLQMLEQGFTAV